MRVVVSVCVIGLVAAIGASSTFAASSAPPVPVEVTLDAPPGFGESCCLAARSGSWLGPEYVGPQGQRTGVRARIDWSIAPSLHARAADAAARAALSKGWLIVEAGVTFVPHRIGSRTVGTITAPYLIAQRPGTARYELSVAAPLHSAVFARVGLRISGTRAGTLAAASTLAVEGVQATDWNMEAVRAAIGSLALEGNLPPSTVTLRARRGSLSGALRDVNGHPLVAAMVSLHRKDGDRWRRVGGTRTTNRGTFVLPKRLVPGVYRASASIAGIEALSRTIRR